MSISCGVRAVISHLFKYLRAFPCGTYCVRIMTKDRKHKSDEGKSNAGTTDEESDFESEQEDQSSSSRNDEKPAGDVEDMDIHSTDDGDFVLVTDSARMTQIEKVVDEEFTEIDIDMMRLNSAGQMEDGNIDGFTESLDNPGSFWPDRRPALYNKPTGRQPPGDEDFQGPAQMVFVTHKKLKAHIKNLDKVVIPNVLSKKYVKLLSKKYFADTIVMRLHKDVYHITKYPKDEMTGIFISKKEVSKYDLFYIVKIITNRSAHVKTRIKGFFGVGMREDVLALGVMIKTGVKRKHLKPVKKGSVIRHVRNGCTPYLDIKLSTETVYERASDGRVFVDFVDCVKRNKMSYN